MKPPMGRPRFVRECGASAHGEGLAKDGDEHVERDEDERENDAEEDHRRPCGVGGRPHVVVEVEHAQRDPWVWRLDLTKTLI